MPAYVDELGWAEYQRPVALACVVLRIAGGAEHTSERYFDRASARILTTVAGVPNPSPIAEQWFVSACWHPVAADVHLIGIIRCWYGVPAHMTYGTDVSGSALFGYMS